MKVDGREITVFQGEYKTSPLIVLNTVQGEGEEIHKITKGLSASDFTLLSVQIDDWNSAMTPWRTEAAASWDSGYEGKADEYIESLTQRIIPEVIVRYSLCPSFIAIAGYSLGGLFALYSMYRTDIFTRFASVSGSLWYPGFAEYTEKNIPSASPARIYISLGNKEAKTGNRIMKTVADCTERICSHYSRIGMDTFFEWNEGNHFHDAPLRMAKGIRYLIS